MSRMHGPQRRPRQPPLPEPVRRLISSLVRAPASSTFQNTLFLMPLQMHTTFMPSKSVRAGGDVSAAGLLSDHRGGAGEELSALGGTGVAGVPGSADVGESQSGPSKPSAVGSRPAKPFFSFGRSGRRGFCPGWKRLLSLRL
jgi:hypothetical protein